MATCENPSQPFIYIRALKEKFPCTEQTRREFYAEADRIRHREQYHGRCICPQKRIWMCDGDCECCEYHTSNRTLSLDSPSTEDGSTLADMLEDASPRMEKIIEDRLLLEQLFTRLRELDPDGDKIIQLWLEHPKGISDRKIAENLGRPQRTFADQMRKYRAELRKIRGE